MSLSWVSLKAALSVHLLSEMGINSIKIGSWELKLSFTVSLFMWKDLDSEQRITKVMVSCEGMLEIAATMTVRISTSLYRLVHMPEWLHTCAPMYWIVVSELLCPVVYCFSLYTYSINSYSYSKYCSLRKRLYTIRGFFKIMSDLHNIQHLHNIVISCSFLLAHLKDMTWSNICLHLEFASVHLIWIQVQYWHL